jgi:hypothetical protein
MGGLESRVVTTPGTKGPFVTVGNTTRDKRWGILYNPRHLSDRHLAISPKSPPLASLPPLSSLPALLAAPVPDERLLSNALPFSDAPLLPDTTPHPDTRASPSPAAPTSAPDRRASPWRGAPPDAAPLPDALPLPNAHLLPNRPCRPPALLLHECQHRRRPWARLRYLAAPELDCGTCRTVPAGQPDRHAAPPPPPPLAAPPVRPPTGLRVPWWPAGPHAGVWPCWRQLI